MSGNPRLKHFEMASKRSALSDISLFSFKSRCSTRSLRRALLRGSQFRVQRILTKQALLLLTLLNFHLALDVSGLIFSIA